MGLVGWVSQGCGRDTRDLRRGIDLAGRPLFERALRVVREGWGSGMDAGSGLGARRSAFAAKALGQRLNFKSSSTTGASSRTFLLALLPISTSAVHTLSEATWREPAPLTRISSRYGKTLTLTFPS